MIDRIFLRSGASCLCMTLLLLGTGCTEDNPTESRGISITEVQESVFDSSCVGCHSGDNPAGGLNLTAAYEALVNVPSSEVPELMLVQPGNAEDSYLYIKIIGGDRMAPGTLRMPISGELTDEQIQLVRKWINEGAER